MKSLLLLAVLAVSCGQHTSPKAQDLGDLDHDTIPNAYDTDKYISDLPSIGIITGKMKIYTPERIIEVGFSNESNFLNLLTKGDLLSNRKKSNMDWTHLSLDFKDKFDLNQPSYKITLQFENDSLNADGLSFDQGKEVWMLGKWSPLMEIELDQDQLEKLRNGQANLNLLRKSPNSQIQAQDLQDQIKENTYNVYFSNGNQNRVMNVSNKLSFNKLVSSLTGEKYVDISKVDLFLNGASTTESWWMRQLNDSTYILMKTSMTKLKANFLEGFNHKSETIARVNGSGASSSVQNSKVGNVHMFTIRANRTLRDIRPSETVEEFSVMQDFGSMRLPLYWKCVNSWLDVKSEYQLNVRHSDLVSNVKVVIDNMQHDLKDLDAKVIENSDNQGVFWNVEFKSNGSEVHLALLDNDSSTFTKTGLLKIKCNHDQRSPRKVQTQNTNNEKEFSLKIESYVEKIN